MTENLNYYWRLAATGGCFAAFGVGGLALSTFVFPILLLCPRRARARRARWVIHKAFGFFLRVLQVLGIMQFEVIGGEKLHSCRKTLVLANHPTLIDVVALISLMPTVSCVVKKALWWNPFLAGVVRAAGYISNAEPDILFEECVENLAGGNSIVMFPEGTRSQPGKPLHFLRGAAYIALKSGMPILPVLIYCRPPTLTKQERWYQIPHQRFHLRIEVLDPLITGNWNVSKEAPALAARKLTNALRDYFTRELENHGRIASTHT